MTRLTKMRYTSPESWFLGAADRLSPKYLALSYTDGTKQKTEQLF